VITLGQKYQDGISGFTGLAVARTEYLHSTPVVGLAPFGITINGQLMKDSVSEKPSEIHWFDEARLKPAPSNA
jgi:hypothetical protein